MHFLKPSRSTSLAILFATVLLLNQAEAEFSIATFDCDVTIPMGHSCMGAGISPAKMVLEPLQAKGFVLMGADKPFVIISFDCARFAAVPMTTGEDTWPTK